MKRITFILLSGLAIAAGQDTAQPFLIHEHDIDFDGEYERIFQVGDSRPFTYFYTNVDGSKVDLDVDPLAPWAGWVLWEADLDGEGDLDPLCRRIEDLTYFYVNEAGEGIDVTVPLYGAQPTQETRQFEEDNPLRALRVLRGMEPAWFIQGNGWSEIDPDDIRDTDDDGLNLFAELELGTIPWLSDTDGDNLLDGWEVNHPPYDPLVPELNWRDHLRAVAFPLDEPQITFHGDTARITGYVEYGSNVWLQVSNDLISWRDVRTLELDLQVEVPLFADEGYLRLVVRP